MAPTMNTCWLCTAGGSSGASGIHQNSARLMASSGGVDAQARQARNSSPAWSTGYITAATGTTGPSGWAVNSNVVTTPKLPPPPPPPEKGGWLGVLRPPRPPMGRHDLPRAQVVAGQPVAAVQPADPPAQRQPGDPGGRDNATPHRQPEGFALAIDIT